MKAIATVCLSLAAFLWPTAAVSQATASPSQTLSQESTATKGEVPKAPPPVTPALVQLGACVNIPQSGAPQRPTSPANTSVVGQVLFTVVPVPGPNGLYNYTLKCGDLAPDNYPHPFVGDFSATRVEVWTAADSKAQFDFLRAEVKATIENAVLNKLVRDQLVQDSVKRAIADQKTLQDAIEAELPAAVDKAFEAKMKKITETVKKEVLDQIKAEQSKNPTQTTKQ